MQKDLTIVRPDPPIYAIGQVVYSRISATKGYMEPLYIANVQFDYGKREWLYSFARDAKIQERALYKNSFADATPMPVMNILPTKLYQTQLMTFCEAIDIQISVLTNDYEAAVTLLGDRCSDYVAPPATQKTYEDSRFRTTLPRSRYGINETVYLNESAINVGRLEPVRISDLKWDNGRKIWMYVIKYEPRPEHNMTIGDNDDWRRAYSVAYTEDELLKFCEAQEKVVTFLQRALNNAINRKTLVCTGGSEATNG